MAQLCTRRLPSPPRASRSDLPTSNLEGTISPLVGAWTDITYFDVDRNALSGPVPASVGNWTKLTDFYVYGNKFEGGVLPAGLPSRR